MNELKPCPFCGKPVSMIYNSLENAFKFYHKSGMDDMNCRVIEPIKLEGRSLADAAEAWNKRVPQTEVHQYGENCTHISNCGTLNLNL